MSKVKRVNIELKEDTHMKAKVIAVLKDITLNEFFESAIEKYIDENKGVLEKIKE
ncbi:hypothetical protein GF327_03755 [Candidatus Woesearchaeota archaeon]|nr:hypothetical protein [Candidatus Woesearchaeota archaeon]